MSDPMPSIETLRASPLYKKAYSTMSLEGALALRALGWHGFEQQCIYQAAADMIDHCGNKLRNSVLAKHYQSLVGEEQP